MAVVRNRGAGNKAGRWQCRGKQREVVPLPGHEGAVEFLPTGFRQQSGTLRAKLLPGFQKSELLE